MFPANRKSTEGNRWDEKVGLRTGCGVRSQVIDVLEARIRSRPAMKKALRKTVDRLRLRRCRAQSAGCGEGPLLEKREKWRTPSCSGASISGRLRLWCRKVGVLRLRDCSLRSHLFRSGRQSIVFGCGGVEPRVRAVGRGHFSRSARSGAPPVAKGKHLRTIAFYAGMEGEEATHPPIDRLSS